MVVELWVCVGGSDVYRHNIVSNVASFVFLLKFEQSVKVCVFVRQIFMSLGE